MQVRDVYLAKAETCTDTFIKTYPLNQLANIMHLWIRLMATNGATSNTVGKLHQWISKIEVLDGSTVLASVSGLELLAFNCFNNGFMPYQDFHGGVSLVTSEELCLCFGRFLGDKAFYLNPKLFTNPMLRISGAYTVSATAGIATGTGAISVVARVIESGAPAYQGFIMRKEISSFTSAASGDQPTVLPVDYPYMGLLVAALKTTIPPDTILTNFKLTRNTDQFVDFNITGRDAFAKNVSGLGYLEQKFHPLIGAAATWLGDLYFQSGAFSTASGATAKGNATVVAAESVTWAGTGGETADLEEITLRGSGPAASVYFPFHTGDPYVPPDPVDFLNPQGIADLRLICTQGVTAAACTVCAEQLHP
jgi:hypothetical protein